MRLMSRLLVSVALLCIAMFTVEATTRDRAGFPAGGTAGLRKLGRMLWANLERRR